jgi:putative hydrolase of the HAD superfamily
MIRNFKNSPIKTIFFDVGNTLLFPNREVIHAPLVERGYTLEAEHLSDLERRTKNQFDVTMTANGSTDHGFWWMFYSQLLSEIGLKDDELRDQLVASIRNSGNWNVILRDTAHLVGEIGERYQIAVISNADGKIKDVLQKCGIAHYFHTITDSGIVGFEKPRPEIFHQALKSMNAAPEESLYVGDVYCVDYLGATGVGMRAMLLDVVGAYPNKGLKSLAEVAVALSET